MEVQAGGLSRRAAGGPAPERQAGGHESHEAEPPWRIYIHNDDITPMDFVVHVLVSVFRLPSTNAEQVLYVAHLNGSAYVQTRPASEARRRIAEARFAARMRGFPLEFSWDPG